MSSEPSPVALSGEAPHAEIAPRRIVQSRGKIGIMLIFFSAAVVLVARDIFDDFNAARQLGMISVLVAYGVFFIVTLWAIINPYVLELRANDFTLRGGFSRDPKTIAWNDVQRFFLYSFSGRRHVVCLNYVPGHAPPTLLMQMNRALGADDGLPNSWPMSAAKLAQILNHYRENALKLPHDG